MAFNPALYNLITFTGLTEAFDPDGNWIIGIQDPTSEQINYVKASDLIALITGTNNLPDGIISGIDQTVNNLTTPKVLSVSAGQWRISSVVYNNNATVNFNIPTADPALDRIDRIYLDTIGVNYQVGTAGGGIPSIPAGSIGLVPFTVPAGGGDITEPSPTLSAQYAVMNSLNTGDFDITGAFKINGVPFTGGSATTPITFIGTDLTLYDTNTYYLPVPILTTNQTIINAKVIPDIVTPEIFYIKPIDYDKDLNAILGIEWDGSSDIRVILTVT